MFLEQLNSVERILAAALFGLILSLWCMGVVLWYHRRTMSIRQVGERLKVDEMEPGPKRVLRLWNDGQEETILVKGDQATRSWWEGIDRKRRQAGWVTSTGVVVLRLILVTALASTLTYLWTHSWLAVTATATATVVLFRAYWENCITRYTARFEHQLVDALELAARSLRAGHPLLGAFRLIAEEIPEPVGRVFAEIGQHHELGLSQEDAIRKVAAGTTSDDMKLFATSVAVQLRSGGNLADMMDRLAVVIRDRMRINRRIRILTAQTQLSKRILVALPFIMFAMLSIVSPGYLRPLYETTSGQMLLATGGVSILMGITMMSRMTRLSY